ncbi:tRNA (adenosine(37)-N6)-dimethylallyltransferase MiaA [Candidatus Cardinium hertigii]|jgi:tRNA dimethylallyltransferase|uniref:tRNA dimethylallyltransferase n=1 Tax=Candidatus Cardinium hertigii TaxID=247481 RepID=A0A3N2QD60_9BACT|nr:tRNA (adenosine(37)-N6)-dimethylallyltransferase MiaA [Candidatus Cardinium hertigii]ROT47728.1 tRNA (adenosine(37)-N6)-dimethylallyltransferase MiaA [Candidatus Cardinium hertigii]
MISPKPKYLVVIAGPTAVGKTTCSIQLAEQFQTEIISADARQFYREIPIGTAQPTKDEMHGIPHHFLSFLSVQDSYSAGIFEKEALQRLQKIFAYHDVVIAVSGSGLYIQALCEGLMEVPTIAPGLRIMLTTLLKERGLPYLTAWLAQKDPDYYNLVDLQNPKRVIRALEICLSTNIAYSTFRKHPPRGDRNFHIIKIGLIQEKTILHTRIDLRVDTMMAEGLLQEAEKVYHYKTANALQTIGYKELFDYIDGKHSLAKAISHIKAHTKQYAKRQLTWFKKDKNISWFTPYDLPRISAYIRQIMLNLLEK